MNYAVSKRSGSSRGPVLYETDILKMMRSQPGLEGREIASLLNADKSEVCWGATVLRVIASEPKPKKDLVTNSFPVCKSLQRSISGIKRHGVHQAANNRNAPRLH